MTHPPKKRHLNKPRQEVVRLTLSQQLEKAQAEFAKASQHLDEAIAVAKHGDAPTATIHAAYYAMHHCAIAVLLVEGGVDKYGDVPKSHEHVAEHFAKLVAGMDEDMARMGPALTRARVDRMSADYDLTIVATIAAARELVVDARQFLARSQSRWPALKSTLG
jgi:uncharacterized protein (UPF0332 family)